MVADWHTQLRRTTMRGSGYLKETTLITMDLDVEADSDANKTGSLIEWT